MLADILAALAFAATPAAALPTPIPITLPSNVFHQLTLAEQHPGLAQGIGYLFVAATGVLIVLMSVQTTKTEGLSGTIGGRAEAAYRGRLGIDQQITRLTNFTAIAWIVSAVIYFVVTR